VGLARGLTAFCRDSGQRRAVELKVRAVDVLWRGDAAYPMMLDNTGVLYDAVFVMHLASQGERLAARG